MTDGEFPDAQSRPLAMARLGIPHQQALAHGDIISAQQLGAAMSALAEPGDAVHINLRCGPGALAVLQADATQHGTPPLRTFSMFCSSLDRATLEKETYSMLYSVSCGC